MKTVVLILSCLFPLAANAFDRDEYPLIDLRARSMHGGLGTVSAPPVPQTAAMPQQQPPVPQTAAIPQQQPPVPRPQYQAPAAPRPAKEIATDSDDVKEYLKNNPQALPDV